MPNSAGNGELISWIHQISPSLNRSKWTQEDCHRLFSLHRQHKNHWKLIATHFEGRTDNSIKNQFFSMARRALRKICRSLGKHSNTMEVNMIKPKVLALFIATDVEIDMVDFGETGCHKLNINEFIKRFAFSKERNLASHMTDRDFYITRRCIRQLNQFNDSYIEGKKIKKRRKRPLKKAVALPVLNISDKVVESESKKEEEQFIIEKPKVCPETVKIGEAIAELQKLIESMKVTRAQGKIEATEFFEKLGRTSFNLYRLLRKVPQKDSQSQSDVLFSSIQSKLTTNMDPLLVSLKKRFGGEEEQQRTREDSLLLSSIFNTRKMGNAISQSFIPTPISFSHQRNSVNIITPTVVKGGMLNPDSHFNKVFTHKQPHALNISANLDGTQKSFTPLPLSRSTQDTTRTNSFKVILRKTHRNTMEQKSHTNTSTDHKPEPRTE